MKRFVLSLVAFSVLTVHPVLGQEEKVLVQQRGDNSVTLNANVNSAGIGYWHKLSDHNDLGLDFTVFYRSHQHDGSQTYQLTPAVKHYLLPGKAVSPYLYAGLLASY